MITWISIFFYMPWGGGVPVHPYIGLKLNIDLPIAHYQEGESVR